LVSTAESKGKKARRDLSLNKTQWGMAPVLALAMAAYAYVLNDPLLLQKVKTWDLAPLTPLVRWLFETLWQVRSPSQLPM
jgi:hypothetical protein